MPIAFLSYFSSSKRETVVVVDTEQTTDQRRSDDTRSSGESSESHDLSPVESPPPEQQNAPGGSLRRAAQSTPNLSGPSTAGNKPQRFRRLSFKPFAITPSREPIHAPAHEQHQKTPALTVIQEHEREERAAKRSAGLPRRLIKQNTDKRAEESALIVRALIMGPPSSSSPKVTKAVAKPKLSNQVKSQLTKPKSANKVIARLRCLSAEDLTPEHDHVHDRRPKGPIHAVCLVHKDEDEQNLHFSKLKSKPKVKPQSQAPSPEQPDAQAQEDTADRERDLAEQVEEFTSIVSASVETLADLFADLRIVDLIANDFGLGQPGDGPGLLAGAVPTAETVLGGIEQITPQLMALGVVVGQSILPDHAGVHPPTDRMSVLTYWWGFELLLPPPSITFLGTVQSVKGTVMNFVSALAMVNNGVREIIPFIRYISQFIDFEWNTIKGQDKGQGVVCAATWIMPAAMVPRPWDFEAAPGSTEPPTTDPPAVTPQPVTPAPDPRDPVAGVPPVIAPLPSVTITLPSPSVETALAEKAASVPVTPPQVAAAA